MKKYLFATITSILMLAGAEAPAQVQITYALDTPTFTLAHEDTDKYEVMDSTYLTLSYIFKYRASETDDSLSLTDIMDLQLGRVFNAFFSRDLRELDKANTESLKTTMQFEALPDHAVGFDILFNNADRQATVTNRLPYTSQVVEYTEGTPKIEWTYEPGETAAVMGYDCHVATANYGGRDWKVYYTDDIPLPYGPWMLNGVKGLVLKAVDTEGNFSFEATGLTQKPQAIIRYDWNRKKMTKDSWRAFERDMYQNAGAFVRNTGARIIIMDNSEKGYHRLNEDWSQYYNPLER